MSTTPVNLGSRTTRKTLPALTGLRFIAALTVVISHGLAFIMPLPGPHPFLYIFMSQLAGIGMPLFFVLSGFVIHYNYCESVTTGWRRGVPNFFIARFARLYPLFFVCLIYTIVYAYTYSQLPETTLKVLPYYATMTQTWIYRIVGGSSLVYQFGNTAVMPAVAWSVSTEWFFYCAYPIMCLGLLRLRTLRHTLLTAAILSAVALFLLTMIATDSSEINRAAVAHFGLIADDSTHHQDSFFRWLVYFSPYSRITEFAIGCLCANAFMHLQRVPVSRREQTFGALLTGFSVVSILITYLIIYTLRGPSALHGEIRQTLNVLGMCFGLALPISLLIFCCARYDNIVIQWLSKPILVQCGEASYSFYLLHLMVIYAFRWESAPITSFTVGIGDFLRFILTLMTAMGLAFVSWRIIEVPSRRWIRNSLTLRTKISDAVLDYPNTIVTTPVDREMNL